MNAAQYQQFLEIVRLSRLRFAGDPATLLKLDEVETKMKQLMEAK